MIPSLITVGSQMTELDWGEGGLPPIYKIGSQNISYKLGLKSSDYVKDDCSTSKLLFFTYKRRFLRLMGTRLESTRNL